MHKQIILACLISVSLQAAPEEAEFVFHSPKTTGKTAGISAAAGASAAAATYYALTSFYKWADINSFPITLFGMLDIPVTDWLHLNFWHTQQITVGEHALRNITIGTAGALGLLAAWVAYSYQPEGKFVEARNRLSEALDSAALNDLLEAEGDLIENINAAYITSAYPRVSAHNDFVRFYKSLKKAAKWLREAINDSQDEAIATFGQSYLSLIEAYLIELADCINIIKSNPNWLEELQTYEAHKLRKAQEDLVRAVRMHAHTPQHVIIHRG